MVTRHRDKFRYGRYYWELPQELLFYYTAVPRPEMKSKKSIYTLFPTVLRLKGGQREEKKEKKPYENLKKAR